MADGLDDPHGILRVGFLNDSVDAKLESYKKLFDVVITNDGPMEWVLNLLHEVLAAKSK